MVMCKYETTNLNSNRTIISRAGMGEANLSVSPSLSFYLKGLILFSSWEMTAPVSRQESVPDSFRLFLTLQDISWIFPYI